MIVKENVTIYQCEFCKKKLFAIWAMRKHINWCTKNPKNIKKCMECKFIQEKKITVNMNGSDFKSTAFRCKVLKIGLYPLIVERKGMVERYPETFSKQKPMPTECSHFEKILSPFSEE